MKHAIIFLTVLLSTLTTAQAVYVPFGVTSGTAKQRIERVSMANCTTGTCTLNSQSGSWVTSITWNATGDYNLNIAAGVFSAAPTCVCSSNAAGSNAFCQPRVGTSTLVNFTLANGTGTAVNSGAQIICMGPR